MDHTIALIQKSHDGDEKARAQLVEENTGLIWCIVKRFYLSLIHIYHMKEVIRGVRNVRAEMNVPTGRKAKVYIVSDNEELCAGFEELAMSACPLMNAAELAIQKDKAGIADDAVSVVVPDAVVYVPLEELIDFEQEIERLQKEEERLNKELARVNGMLNNEKRCV